MACWGWSGVPKNPRLTGLHRPDLRLIRPLGCMGNGSSTAARPAPSRWLQRPTVSPFVCFLTVVLRPMAHPRWAHPSHTISGHTMHPIIKKKSGRIRTKSRQRAFRRPPTSLLQRAALRCNTPIPIDRERPQRALPSRSNKAGKGFPQEPMFHSPQLPGGRQEKRLGYETTRSSSGVI